MPRWSVVVPVLDGQDFVRAALMSALRTLPRDAEVRVMDDGSTDETPQILARLAAQDPRLRIHRHNTPQGVSASLNELILAGDSLYVGRMDADDIVLPGRWEHGEWLLTAADMAFTSVAFVDEKTRLRGMDQPGHFSPDALPLHLLLGCCLVHPTAMMRRSSLTSVGNYADTKAEDYELWLRSTAAGLRLVRGATPGLLYRRHSGQVTLQAPWMDEGTSSVLWRSYERLAVRALGCSPHGLPQYFSAALHTGPIDSTDMDRVREVTGRIAEASRGLGGADRALLAWRLRRQMSRMTSRAGG